MTIVINRYVSRFAIVFVCQTYLISCVNEFSITNRESRCVPPAIDKNIVGTWRFESNYLSGTTSMDTGTVTFTADGKIIDPDGLLESELSGQRVIAKSYAPNQYLNSSNYTGYTFQTYQDVVGGGRLTVYFILVSNACNRIHLQQFRTANNGVGITLAR